ncbi:MAG: hypothetical protein Fur0043_02990 [Anaerolineales bacterium]
MTDMPKRDHPKMRNLALALMLVSPLLTFLFAQVLPPAGDFLDAFWPAAHTPLTPYQHAAFLNPPWVALILYPLSFLTERYAQAILAFLNLAMTLLLTARYGGKRLSFLLAATSPAFLSLLVNGNIGWIPMAAFLLPANWGVILLLSKPQDGLMAGLIWFKRTKNPFFFLLPSLGLFAFSFVTWGWWVPLMLQQGLRAGGRPIGPWNISPFPWLLPLGFILLWVAWKLDDELLAVAATLCLAPYFAFYSLNTLYTMMAGRYPRLAILAWVLLWAAFLSLQWLGLNFY